MLILEAFWQNVNYSRQRIITKYNNLVKTKKTLEAFYRLTYRVTLIVALSSASGAETVMRPLADCLIS